MYILVYYIRILYIHILPKVEDTTNIKLSESQITIEGRCIIYSYVVYLYANSNVISNSHRRRANDFGRATASLDKIINHPAQTSISGSVCGIIIIIIITTTIMMIIIIIIISVHILYTQCVCTIYIMYIVFYIIYMNYYKI